MLNSALARRWFYLMVGLLSAGGALLGAPRLSSALANEQAVPEAELAIQPLLPQGARVLSSRRLSDTEAEIWVESRRRTSPVIMRLNAAGTWEQDLSATLSRGASYLQVLAQQQMTDNLPDDLANPPVPPLVQITQGASSLIPPADREQETQRALRGAGRADPFVPQNTRAPAPEIALPPLPPLPELPPPGNGDVGPTAVATPVPTPTPDPAAFARSVQVSGIVQIGGEAFALISSPVAIPSVVQAGQNYRTANVTGVSASERKVVLSEGGETVVKTMEDTTVVVGAP